MSCLKLPLMAKESGIHLKVNIMIISQTFIVFSKFSYIFKILFNIHFIVLVTKINT